jgi:hypothetical protein
MVSILPTISHLSQAKLKRCESILQVEPDKEAKYLDSIGKEKSFDLGFTDHI